MSLGDCAHPVWVAAPPLPSSSSNAWGGPQVYFLLWVLTLLPPKICFQIPTNVDNFFFQALFYFPPKFSHAKGNRIWDLNFFYFSKQLVSY